VIKKIEHLGIAVSNLKDSEKLFEKLLGTKPYKTENVLSEGVTTSFFKIANQKIELLASNKKNSSIQNFIEKRKEGIHHLALHVDSIEREIKRLEALGFEFISKKAKKGADNKRIVFLHPKSTNGVLVELCEDIKDVL
jgi:methylmalonyl-CoA/ethylmalonyl-CoA epimerase|tara:strand:+ start:6735 stop:7148 length:414 start_codon:yes stop_codon:yes gene_type:complete